MPQDLSSDFPFSVLDMVLMGRFPYRQVGYGISWGGSGEKILPLQKRPWPRRM